MTYAEDGLTDQQRALALGWYGYGRWHAPYWFIGIEPGGDELDACVRMWNALGREELLDIAAHHAEHEFDWFSDAATKPQATWQRLIWLLLSYQNIEPTAAAVLEYQKKRLGRANDETALVELSALPANNVGIPRPRMLFRSERVEIIRERLLAHQPRFAIFYSPDNGRDRRYVDAWNAITKANLVRDVPALVGRTACVMTYHPNGKWAKAYWVSIADKLRNLGLQNHTT